MIPIFVASLPLKNDFLENRAVFKCIFHLFRVSPQLLQPHIDHLFGAFAQVLDPAAADQIGDDVRAELIELLKHLSPEVPKQIEAYGLAKYIS